MTTNTGKFPYFASWDYNFDRTDRTSTIHARHWDRPMTFCGIEVYRHDGSAWETIDNEDEKVECATCRAILRLS